MYSRTQTMKYTTDYLQSIKEIKDNIEKCDALIIGAGAGLSTAAGFIYTGERFERYFSDFIEKYGFEDMYSGGFYPFADKTEFWAYWSRYIYVNRYMNPSFHLYDDLLKLVNNKDYFVITTNVDHCFQKAGFDKKRLFYTQGDYGLFQCSKPCHKETYDNKEIITKMVLSQGFIISDDGTLVIPDNGSISMKISEELIPVCPVCGREMTMNLRSDNRFVEDEGWHEAAERYQNYLRTRSGMKTVFLELGVGYNTPGIIKYPFWNMAYKNPDSKYICLNYDDISHPREIDSQTICIKGDCRKVIENLISTE